MEPLRLEELLRVLALAVLAAFGSVIAYLFVHFFGRIREPAEAVMVVAIFGSIVWVIAFVSALLGGLVAHLILRRFHLSRITVLCVFTVVAAIALVIVRLGVTSLSAAAGGVAVAWLGYCFGPLALWRYRFDPASDTDF